LVTLAFAGCTSRRAQPQHQANTLVVAVRKEPVALNPLLLEGLDSYTYGPLIFSYLTRYDPSGRTVGDLASVVPSIANGGVSPDGKRITFHLRRGVVWQDGVPLTSRDVLFTYRAVMNPLNNVPQRYAFDLVSSIDAPDPHTVVVHLKHAFSPIIGWFFGGDNNYQILPAHLLAGARSINTVAFNAQPIGSGPYRFERWDRGDHITLSANASYYMGRPRIDRLVLPFIQDDSTTINELHTGEIDAAFLVDASRIAELRAIPNHRVVVTPVPYFYALAFNLRDPILADRSVRQALAEAVDNRGLTRKITLGVYDSDTAMRGLFTWAFDPSVKSMPYDPVRAAALLARDGWIAGPDGIRVKNGRRLRLELSFATGLGITTRFVTAIAAAERSIGVDMTLRQYARTQYLETGGPFLGGRYQVSLYDYQAAYDPDASWLLACDQRAPHGFNVAAYCNPAVDALLQRAASSFDRKVRIAAYRSVQRQIASDLPYDFICQISEVDVVPSKLGGFAPPLLTPFGTAAAWYWE
jgi:peptide/nickel transport system substrate-binding protein